MNVTQDFTIKPMELEAGGKTIVFLHEKDAEEMGVHALDRVKVSFNGKSITAIADVTRKFVKENETAISDKLRSLLEISPEDKIKIGPASEPESIRHIRHKLKGEQLGEKEIEHIVQDVVDRKLSDIEISSFLTSLEIRGLSMDEIEGLSKAMIKTGKTLDLGIEGPILDKHNVGGVPGDKTTMLVVPIIAAAGHYIPKTSSRAITSPAGTADKVEVITNVDLSLEEIRETVKKTKGCMVWGGAVELAPADDLFIQVEYPLAIDPMLLPSIMSKKKCAGSTHVVIDIPCGQGAKFSNVSEARYIANNFVELGKRLDMEVRCAITNGEQPLGRAIGPALEVREVLEIFNGKEQVDQVEKATHIAGILLEMIGETKNGKAEAYKILKSGEAEKKFREIIEAQGGDPRIRVEDINVGEPVDVKSKKSGLVYHIDNKKIAAIARAAGAPKDKGAGVLLHAKVGERVGTDELIFEIFAEKDHKRKAALDLAKEIKPFTIIRNFEKEVLIEKVGKVNKRLMLLER